MKMRGLVTSASTSRTNSARRSPRCHFVERRKRLVAQQDIGIDGKGAGNRYALAHAAGQCVRVIILMSAEAQPLQPSSRCRLPILSHQSSRICRPRQDVIERATPGHQPIVLEYDTDLCRGRMQIQVRTGHRHTTAAVPDVSSVMPATMLNIVNLPQPVACPRTATITPVAIV